MLLIDTCVIIEAYRLHVWEALVKQCKIAVPETVVGETILVAREFDDFEVNIEKQIHAGQIEVPSLSYSDLTLVHQKCGPKFQGQIDEGELECLAYLLKDPTGNSLICSSDAVVFRYLGWIQQGDRGISLEEVLAEFEGRRRANLQWKLGKSFREKYADLGFQEALQKGFLQL